MNEKEKLRLTALSIYLKLLDIFTLHRDTSAGHDHLMMVAVSEAEKLINLVEVTTNGKQ